MGKIFSLYRIESCRISIEDDCRRLNGLSTSLSLSSYVAFKSFHQLCQNRSSFIFDVSKKTVRYVPIFLKRLPSQLDRERMTFRSPS